MSHPGYLKLGGSVVSEALLDDVVVTQELNRHSWCEVSYRSTRDLRFPVEDMLGMELEVVTRSDFGSETTVFSGFVLDAKLIYEVEGRFGAHISGVSRSYKLDVTEQERYWRKATWKEVADDLCGDDGLAVKFKATEGNKRNYVQWGETDFNFLRRLADEHQSWILPTAQGVEISNSFAEAVEAQWSVEGGLSSFSIGAELSPHKCTGVFYDPKTMESTRMEGVFKKAPVTGAMSGLVSSQANAAKKWMPEGYVHFESRCADKEDFKKRLERESQRGQGSGLFCQGESKLEEIRAGASVAVVGLRDASGKYNVTKVVHSWTKKGYQNKFWGTPWSLWMEAEPVKPRLIDGVTVARVVEHNDPRKMGRLQVQYDWLSDGASAWARMVTPHAGADRGFLFLPEKGDEVLVAFEQGDPERPYILGSLWNGRDNAPRAGFWGEDIENNDVKRIVTKSGHRIQFSDKEGKEAIVIATPNHLTIGMYEKTDETGRSMILMRSDTGDIVLSAPTGRVHVHSKFFSREVGPSAPPPAPAKTNPEQHRSITPAASQPVNVQPAKHTRAPERTIPESLSNDKKPGATLVAALPLAVKAPAQKSGFDKFWNGGEALKKDEAKGFGATGGGKVERKLEKETPYKGWGSLEKDSGKKPEKFEKEVKVGAEYEWLNKSDSTKLWGDDKNNIQKDVWTQKATSGLQWNPKEKSVSASLIDAEVKYSKLTAEGEKKILGDYLKVKGDAEALGVAGTLKAKAEYSDKVKGVVGEVGAEAIAAKVSASVEAAVGIPFTDYKAYAVGTVEGLAGAGASAKGQAGYTAEDGWAVGGKLRAYLGVGGGLAAKFGVKRK